jgi:hypothetical protein
MKELKNIFMQSDFSISFSIIFTLIGGIWACVTYIISRRESKWKDLISRRESESREQIEKTITIRQLNSELKIWADDVIDILSAIGHLCDLDPKRTENFFIKRHDLLIKLSAQIDKGRFYLPNTNKSEYGQHKQSAFQGITREPISHMKKCYKILDKQISYLDGNINTPLKKELMDIKRSFCASIQDELNPQKYFIEFRKNMAK